MAITDSIINYRRFLKRRNYSKYTLRNYMNTLRHFVLWLDVPIEEITHKKLLSFIDHLLDKRLKPKTINCYLYSIRGFYEYLIHEEASCNHQSDQTRLCHAIVPASTSLSSRRTNP